MIRRIFNRIRLFFSWVPVIWKDHQNDYSYFYMVMRHKLYLMEQFFEDEINTNHSSKKIVMDIKKCILTLDRIIKDDYILNRGIKAENRVFLEVYEKESFLVEQDKRYLFNMLRNHLHTWRK